MPASTSNRVTVLAFFSLLSILALTPVAIVTLPPILDYPNHMARMHILAALPSTAELARYYAIHWTVAPNLALDATVPWLVGIASVEDAMRLSLAFILLGLAGGCLALHRVAFGRWSLWPLTGFLLLYNRMLLWGFLNYLAGLALALWAVAAWLALERRSAALRVIVGMVMATTIYLAHLAAFGCYALAIIVLSLTPFEPDRSPAPKLRRAFFTLITLIPAAALFLMSPTVGAPTAVDYGNPLRKFDLPVSLFDNYNRIFDGATFAVLLIAAIIGLIRGSIVLHPRMRWCLIALLMAFVLLPSRLLSASGIDHRLPIAIGFIFIATTDWTGLDPRRMRIVGGMLIGLLLIRMTVIGAVWLRADQEYALLRPGLDRIMTGDAVAIAAPARSVQAGGIPLLHFPTLAVIDRNAFVPTVFADPLQQPVRLTELGARLGAEVVPAALWQMIRQETPPALPGYEELVIVDPPRPLRLDRLPGAVVFDAPRLIVVRLPHPSHEGPK